MNHASLHAMRSHQRTRFIGLICFSLLCVGSTTARANLDIAFVLDTTGSMSKELREVKEKVRIIADSLYSARPDQTIRIGVVAYRDITDKYVTKFSPLSSNIEDAFTFLATLRAKGGGDRPEHVVAGLEAALNNLEWDQSTNTKKQIFLIGDARAQTSYANQTSIAALGEIARQKGVVINSIGCRSLSRTGIRQFRTIAYSTEGRYQHIGGIRNDSASLTSSVLQTLSESSDTHSRPGKILESVLSDKQEVSTKNPFFTSLFRSKTEQGEYCKLWLQTPEGWELDGEPVLRSKGNNIYILTRVKSGFSHRYGLTLKSCLTELEISTASEVPVFVLADSHELDWAKESIQPSHFIFSYENEDIASLFRKMEETIRFGFEVSSVNQGMSTLSLVGFQSESE